MTNAKALDIKVLEMVTGGTVAEYEELFVDFRLSKSHDVYRSIKEYVTYFNNQRPCYSLGYDTPVRYYDKYISGQLEVRDTFSKRELSTLPKYVQKKREKKCRR